MATYDFATITAQQALDLRVTDQLTFTGGPARDASVIYHTQGDSLDPTGFTVTFEGRAVDFGPGLLDLSAHFRLGFDDLSLLLIGGSGADTLEGGPAEGLEFVGRNDALFGGPGNDVLWGAGFNDAIQGNQGNDTIEADEGADILYGGQGNDVIITGLGREPDKADFAQGNKGDDTIHGGAGSDTLLGGQGDDSIDGGAGADVLNGNLGNDVLVAHGAVRMFGEDGADTLSAQAAGVVLSGGAGADLFVFSTASGLFAAQGFALASTITDWEATDHLHIERIGSANIAGSYVETRAPDLGDAALTLDSAYEAAQWARLAGAQTIAVEVAGSVLVFSDTDPAVGLELGIVLVGRTLADIDASNFM